MNKFYQYQFKTQKWDMINITNYVKRSIIDSGIKDGIAIVYCPHTTAGITINENADPDVVHDLIVAEQHFFPKLPEYQHFEGNSHAHLLSSLVGASETILVNEGSPILGTWQSIYFCEFDGPRNRKVVIEVMD